MANTLAQECGRLEALNRELLEALKLALSYIPEDGTQDRDRREAIEDIIAKVEKGG